jgi:hypothetical protein
LGGEAEGHFQGVGAVVVVAEGELAELIEEKLGRWAIGFQAAGGTREPGGPTSRYLSLKSNLQCPFSSLSPSRRKLVEKTAEG